MRLTKTLFIVEETDGEIIGYDDLGRPVYGTITTKTPFDGEVEPFSSNLAETRYGLIAEVSNRVFCYPNDNIQLNTKIEYNEENYTVTGNMKYDRHFEVLIKKD